MLTKIAMIATESVPGCDLASITMIRNGHFRTPVFTDKAAVVLDEAQYQLGDGPCLSAIRHRGVEQVDTRTDVRWPSFNAAAVRLNVLGCLSLPLVADEVVVGGLNMYSKSAGAYNDDAREMGNLFADQLGVA